MDVAPIATAFPARPSWNPLRCEGTPLPPGWLLSAKLLAFGLFPARHLLEAGPPFLPFVPWLDAPFFSSWLAPAVIAVFYAAVAALMFNRFVRTACVAIACSVFVHVVAHRLAYANSLLFPCVLLLLIGLYSPRLRILPLRLQLGLIYLGASLNKTLDADWWQGRFFDTLMIDALSMRWYEVAASWLPGHTFGTILGMLTIGVEASIAAAAFVDRTGRAGLFLMIAFHATMLVLTGGQLSMPFFYTAVAIAPAFLGSLDSHGRAPWTSPVIWWPIVLVVRFFPRLFLYAHPSRSCP